MFNVPEVESPIVKKIVFTTSIKKKELPQLNKKTVQIHTLTSKNHKTKLNGKIFSLMLFTVNVNIHLIQFFRYYYETANKLGYFGKSLCFNYQF